MFLHRLRQSHTRNVIAFWLIPLVLLFLGLRACLHAPDTANPGLARATAVHLESDLTLPADTDDDANDRHVDFGSALVKQLTDNLAFAVLLMAVWVLFLPRTNQQFAVPRDASPEPSADLRLRPPPRAPPRYPSTPLTR